MDILGGHGFRVNLSLQCNFVLDPEPIIGLRVEVRAGRSDCGANNHSNSPPHPIVPVGAGLRSD